MVYVSEPVNPGGVASYGVVMHDERSKTAFYATSGVIGEGKGMTNQIAEYEAVVQALTALLRMNRDDEEIVIYTDSQMVANQMNGHWRANHGEYLGTYLKAKELAERFHYLKVQWIPREENQEADRLSQIAYETHMMIMGRTPKYYRKRG